MKASQRLSEMFRDARIAGQRSYWVREHIWNSLLAHWNSPQYRIKCATTQKNRASEKGGVMHTRGSINTQEHAIRMATELGRVVHIDEVFTQTHLRKGTGEYVGERSCKTILRSFSARLTQARSEGNLLLMQTKKSSGPNAGLMSSGGRRKDNLPPITVLEEETY